MDKPRALVVEGDDATAEQLAAFLEERVGLEVVRVKDGEAGYNVLDSSPVNVVVTDLKAHRIDGLRLLEVARARNPEVCVVVIDKQLDLELATEAMRHGAWDFQVKPLNLEKLKAVLDRALSHQRLVTDYSELRERLDHRYGLPSLTGHSREMITVYDRIRQIAPSRATVLIEGETGTGKELVAKALHHASPRRNERFVALNCGALADGVVESELFGHEKGAFTGADQARQGRFELADGGTLFLDEISEVSPSTQLKLLRVLETREFERVGGSTPIAVDVRVIAASNRPLDRAVAEGKFREDLLYRLKVVVIQLPPLRERKSDIPLLADHFLREFNDQNGKSVTGLTRGAMELLMQHEWPGNVRELRNLMEGMVVFGRDGKPLDVGDLPLEMRSNAPAPRTLSVPIGTPMSEVERRVIEETLKAYGHDKPKTAKALDIGLRTLYRKMKEYDLDA
ncbi:MAG TPA: sigma-54 dependent transcriptional regulator [Candidatus Eisenbacteria bacterium]